MKDIFRSQIGGKSVEAKALSVNLSFYESDLEIFMNLEKRVLQDFVELARKEANGFPCSVFHPKIDDLGAGMEGLAISFRPDAVLTRMQAVHTLVENSAFQRLRGLYNLHFVFLVLARAASRAQKLPLDRAVINAAIDEEAEVLADSDSRKMALVSKLIAFPTCRISREDVQDLLLSGHLLNDGGRLVINPILRR